jgi:hypothetical protein
VVRPGRHPPHSRAVMTTITPAQLALGKSNPDLFTHLKVP